MNLAARIPARRPGAAAALHRRLHPDAALEGCLAIT